MNKKSKRATRRFEEQLRITTARKRVCDTIDLIRAEKSAGDMQRAYELLVGMEEAVLASRSLRFLRAYRLLVVAWSLL